MGLRFAGQPRLDLDNFNRGQGVGGSAVRWCVDVREDQMSFLFFFALGKLIQEDKEFLLLRVLTCKQ